jgi:ankyrin repeat protein
MIKAIAARDRTAVETELKTTSPNSHPPFDDAEDYVPALVYAVQSKDQAMVRLLLEHGADPNLGDCFEGAALTYAAVDDDVSMMTLLLHYGSTDQDVKDRALWRSSVEGKMNAVKVLLAHGADPDQILQQWDKPKGVGEPLSRIVVDQGHPEIAPLLLKASKKGKH